MKKVVAYALGGVLAFIVILGIIGLAFGLKDSKKAETKTPFHFMEEATKKQGDSASILGGFLAFVIIIGILGVTVWLIVKEFKKMNDTVLVTEETTNKTATGFTVKELQNGRRHCR